MDPRLLLREIFMAGVESCLPAKILPPHLPTHRGRTIVLAIGKAAAGMASVAEELLEGPVSGLAVAKEDVTTPLRRIELVKAAHPVPDARSVRAAERLMECAVGAGAGDLVLVLLSGGASSLAALPAEGLSLEGKQSLTAALLRSGASIAEINCVRRHLSGIKGGRLGRAAQPARLLTLAISDVVGSATENIGSGPTAPDPTSCGDARAVLARYGIADPGLPWSESVKPAEAAAWTSEYRIVASGRAAVDAAARAAASLGFDPHVIEHEAEGEATDVGRRHASLAIEAAAAGRRAALISGGELVVTVAGGGAGGPNHEYALAAGQALAGQSGIWGLAGDSDGLDGASGAAGAFFCGQTIARAKALGFDAGEALARNDSAAFFSALQDQLVTGPTGTNVNDLRIILIEP